MQDQIYSILSVISSSGFLVWVGVLGAVIPMFFLWNGYKTDSKKDKYYRQEQVFDFIIISLLSGLVLSRILFLYYNWGMYENLRWFIIPYEKVQDQVLWFESFPWIFFKINVRTINIEGLVIGFLLGILSTIKIHRLDWKRIAIPITDYIGLSLIFGFWGLFIMNENQYFLYPILVLSTLWLMKQLTRDSFDYFRKFTEFLWKIIVFLGIPAVFVYRYISNDYYIYSRDFYSLLVICLVSVLFVWRVLNIKFAKKKKAKKTKVKKVTRKTPRSFTLSYKTLGGGWWKKITSSFKKEDDEK